MWPDLTNSCKYLVCILRLISTFKHFETTLAILIESIGQNFKVVMAKYWKMILPSGHTVTFPTLSLSLSLSFSLSLLPLCFLRLAISGLFFVSKVNNKTCSVLFFAKWLDSNTRPLEWEATTLPTVPQPLHLSSSSWFIFLSFYFWPTTFTNISPSFLFSVFMF